MKLRILAGIVLAAFFAVVIAAASITLSNSAVVTKSVGGSTVETDNTAAATYMEVSWQANTVRLFYQYGSGGNSFAPGTQGGLTVTVDLGSGNWTTTNGGSGTLTAAQLSNCRTRSSHGAMRPSRLRSIKA